MKKCVVITTINRPLKGVIKFIEETDFDVIIVGDLKTPDNYKTLDCIFLDVDTQKKLFPKISELLPYNHYSRKNIGYLYAITNGYELIAESDDDTIPEDNWGNLEHYQNTLKGTIVEPKFPNIYNLYSDEHIWPRGFPLENVNKQEKIKLDDSYVDIGIWQGLVNGDPDVDSIFRMTSNAFRKDFCFDGNDTCYRISPNVLTPGNTQNTIWCNKECFKYMYVPSTVTFRYCDILRSYVTHFGIKKKNLGIGLTYATVFQERNEHNLLKDFVDEIPVFTQFEKVVDVLKNVKDDSLFEYYRQLNNAGIVSEKELSLVKEWEAIIS